MHGHFSEGSDVFSFGVLVLEIISGKKNSCFHPSDYGENFLSHVRVKQNCVLLIFQVLVLIDIN